MFPSPQIQGKKRVNFMIIIYLRMEQLVTLVTMPWNPANSFSAPLLTRKVLYKANAI